MNVDGQIDLLGCGQDRIEAFVVEKQSAAGTVHKRPDETQFVDAPAHLVGGGRRIMQRNRGESAESGGVLRDLLCK